MLRTPPPTALNTYLLEITTSPVAKLRPVLKKILVSSTYGTARYLQLHSAASLPADGAVPLMAPLEIAINAKNVEIDFPEGLPIDPNGLVIVASSTAGTLTKDTSATWFITAFIEEYEDQLDATHTVTGDLTTGVASKQVWADSAGPKTLKRVQAKNNNGAVRYLCLYAEDSPDADSKILAHIEIPANGKVDWHFGGGISPMQLDDDGTIHDGCTILGQDSLTPGDTASGTDFNIRATYI